MRKLVVTLRCLGTDLCAVTVLYLNRIYMIYMILMCSMTVQLHAAQE